MNHKNVQNEWLNDKECLKWMGEEQIKPKTNRRMNDNESNELREEKECIKVLDERQILSKITISEKITWTIRLLNKLKKHGYLIYEERSFGWRKSWLVDKNDSERWWEWKWAWKCKMREWVKWKRMQNELQKLTERKVLILLHISLLLLFFTTAFKCND